MAVAEYEKMDIVVAIDDEINNAPVGGAFFFKV